MRENTLFSIMYRVMAFAVPISSAGIINMIYSFIAMMMVAILGKEQLAAAALAVTTYMAIMTVVGTIFYAVGILISHHRGQDKAPEEIGQIVKNGIWLAILLGFPSGLGLWYVDRLLLFFGQDPQLVMLTRGYFQFAAIGMFPLLLSNVVGQFYAGTGKPRFTMLMAVISMPLSILAAYGFVLGHFGMPTLGLGGVTCANLVVQSLMIFIVLMIMQLGSNTKPYQIFQQPFLPNLTICRSIFTLGLPIGIQFGGELAAMTAATYLLGYFGVIPLAASQIVSQYAMIIVMITLGLTQSLSLLVSEALGKSDIDLIKIYIRASMIILIIIFMMFGILFIGFPSQLVKFYINANSIDSYLIYLTKIFFALSAIFILVDGIRHLLSGALRGLHDSRAPMRIGIIALWAVSLPSSYLIGFTLDGGPIGLRIGFMSGFIFAAILLWLRLDKKLLSLSREEK